MRRIRRAAWIAVAALALLLAALRLPRGPAAQAGAPAAPLLAYGSAIPGLPAPAFTLQGPTGAPVSLGGYRGRAVVLGFVDRRAAGAAETASLLHTVAEEIGPGARRVAVLAVNTDPTASAPGLTAWAAAQGLTGSPPLLTGSAAQIRQVATAYNLGGELNGGALVHASATYLLGPGGRERFVVSTAGAADLPAEAHALAAAALALGR